MFSVRMEGQILFIYVLLVIGLSSEVSEAGRLCEFAAKFPNVGQQCYQGKDKPVTKTTPSNERKTPTTEGGHGNIPRDCSDVYKSGGTESGIYTIGPTNWEGPPFEVYCNNSNGGGWTVFQRRVDGSVDFYRNWANYTQGFGELDHEFWLGNDKLYYLTNQRNYSLRIDFYCNGSYYAVFDYFRINDESDLYRLSGLGNYSGTADQPGHAPGGFALSSHLNSIYSTFDRDNDEISYNCAVHQHGGWWYKNCGNSNLNGDYHKGPNTAMGIRWYDLPGGLTFNITYTEMKIRPT